MKSEYDCNRFFELCEPCFWLTGKEEAQASSEAAARRAGECEVKYRALIVKDGVE